MAYRLRKHPLAEIVRKRLFASEEVWLVGWLDRNNSVINLETTPS